MTDHAYAQPFEAHEPQKLHIPGARITVMDIGSWTFNGSTCYQYFGVVAGSYYAIGSFTDGERAPLPSNIGSKPIRELFQRTGAQAVHHCWGKIRPLAATKELDAELLLTNTDRIYLFIPDCHLGLKDSADDFYGHAVSEGGLAPDHSVRALSDFLEKATQNNPNVVVIQTGDFFDIWEAEAKNSIYYENIFDYPVIQDDKPHPPVPRSRLARIHTAAERIADAWLDRTNPPPRDNIPTAAQFRNVLARIHCYLPGNHDTEIRFLSQSAICRTNYRAGMAVGDAQLNAHGDSLEHPSNDKAAKAAWIAEHGNNYDSHNPTTGVVDANTAMDVDGKSITFAWARAERGEYVPGEAPPSQYPRWQLRDAKDNRTIYEDTFRNRVLKKVTWVGEQWNFLDMRNRILTSLYERTKALNPGVQFSRLAWSDGPSWYKVWWWKEGPYEPLVLPLRLYIHGHTHDRKLYGIRFVRRRRDHWGINAHLNDDI